MVRVELCVWPIFSHMKSSLISTVSAKDETVIWEGPHLKTLVAEVDKTNKQKKNLSSPKASLLLIV